MDDSPSSKIPSPEERRIAVSGQTFAMTNRIWNEQRFNSVDNLGQVFKEIRKANALYLTKNFEMTGEPVLPLHVWQEYYLKNVRPTEKIEDIARDFRAACKTRGILLTEKAALCFCLYRTIDQTYDGLMSEVMAMLVLKQKDPVLTFRMATDEEDRMFCVDFIGMDVEGNIKKAFQQKPETFFRALEAYCNGNTHTPEWVRDSANRHYKANKKFSELYGVPVEYISITIDDDGIHYRSYGYFIQNCAAVRLSHKHTA